MLSQEEKGIQDKLSEKSNSTILGNTKAPHKTSTLGDIIKDSSHKIDFVDTPNVPYKNDLIVGEHNNDNDGDTSMIITKFFRSDNNYNSDIRKIISIPNHSYTQSIKENTIYGTLYRKVNT